MLSPDLDFFVATCLVGGFVYCLLPPPLAHLLESSAGAATPAVFSGGGGGAAFACRLCSSYLAWLSALVNSNCRFCSASLLDRVSQNLGLCQDCDYAPYSG